MNSTIETILSHRSVRAFENKPLSKKTVDTLIQCAQQASTSSYIQAYSIIGVTNPDKKKALAELAGPQSYVEENGHFFVFCADLKRHEYIGKREETNVIPSLESTEKFMVALIDASLAAQNMAIAAESLGYGICYIGGIRNNLEKASELLQTPDRVLPLFGLCVGLPTKDTEKKPRLPLHHIYHENTYNNNEKVIEGELREFDEIVSAYYAKRTNGKRNQRWSEQMASMLKDPKRSYMKEFVKGKGFDVR
ncbi:oxygen-insensitive NADPH nitroreductase [Thalassobacillus sp. C254]|uniref:oxygen-insensitive NADPH nitroreductase n=1 Tax=Thalassobacillus sp. C254 TaxID=1225341 RepID=UPI0006D243CF|nr:oxygen-insensitive NADPH nitroreductase [Thalassobacillus sp. C254]